MILTKEFVFNLSHLLPNETGDSSKMHGHTYRLHVSIEGEVKESGMVLDFNELNRTVKATLKKLDYNHLNKIIENPTTENMAIWLWDALIKDLLLSEIKLWESPYCSVTYTGKPSLEEIKIED